MLSAAIYLFAGDASSQIELHTFLDQDNVAINREVVYHVELTWSGDLNRFRISEASEPVVTNLTLRGSGSSNRFYTTAAGEPRSVKRITYYFKPTEMGMAYIDGATISYEDRLTMQKESLFAQRLGVKITEPADDDNSGQMVGKWILIGLAVLFGAVVVFFVLRYFQRRRLQDAADETPVQTIEEKYLEQLRNVNRMPQDKSSERLTVLSRLVQSYLAEKYQISPASGFEVIRGKFESIGLEASIVDKLQKFFEHVELSRFAGDAVGSSELHIDIDTIEILLNRLNKMERNDDKKLQ
jgi:hypothetical protein